MKKIDKLKNFITECKRVLRISKKPTKQEYWTITKVSGIGLLIIGFAGFLLLMIDYAISIFLSAAIVLAIVLYLLFAKKN